MVKPRRQDWESYRGPFDYNKWIKNAGDVIYDALYKIIGETDNTIRATEYLSYAAFIPNDYRSFRGLTAYLARKAASDSLCFVVSPVIKPTYDNSHEIIVEDWEFALIRSTPVETIEEIERIYMEDRGYV